MQDQLSMKIEITRQLKSYNDWGIKEFSWTKYQYDTLIATMIMETATQVRHAKDRASEQEQTTRRAFAAAFEARITELESDVTDRDDQIVHLSVQLDQYQMKMKSAEELLLRLR